MDSVPNFIAGRYEIVDRIGQGGMGSLYRARDTVLDRIVAIKVLRDGFDNDELRQRFVREARSAARLSHRNIVTVHDFGEYLGQPYIVMEFIPGETLAQTIRAQKPLALGLKLQYMEDVCQGLFHAHKGGIVHRDVKPANVIVDQEGTLKILDFGIARLGDSSMTQGGILGTLNYMSPEQIAGSIDHRSDIFAVGALFYELVSYRQAFPGNMETGVLHRILNNAPQALRELYPGLDPEIERIVFHALEKNPSQRYQDLGVMRKDIAKVRSRLGEAEEAAADDTVATVVVPAPGAPTPVGPVPTPRTPPRRGSDRDMLAKLRAQQIQGHLQTARKALDAADFDSAQAACEQVLVIDPDYGDALALMDEVRAAHDEALFRQALDAGRKALARGELTEAERFANETLAKQSNEPGAVALRKAVDEARRAREEERRKLEEVARLVDTARRELAAQNYEAAIAAADAALALDAKHGDAPRLRADAVRALEARRRAEEQQRLVEQAVNDARQAFAAGDHERAIASLAPLAPRFPAASQALDEMRTEFDRIQRQRREEEERAARRRRVAEQLEGARAAIAAGRFDDALRRVREAQRLDPEAEGAAELAEAIQAGQAAAEAEAARQRELDRHLRAAGNALRQGQFDEARAAVDSALALDAASVTAREIAGQIDEAVERARARQELERQAREAVESADTLFNAGRHGEALALLDAFTPRHDLVARARTDLSARLQALERQRLAEEARQKAEAERLAAEQYLRSEIERLRGAYERREFDGAIAQLQSLQSRFPASTDVSRLLDEVTAARRAADEAAERERQFAAKLAEAEDRLARQDYAGALKRATAALAIVPDSEPGRALVARIEREQAERRIADEQARAAEELARRVASGIRKAAKTKSHDAAVGMLRELLALDPGNEEIARQIAGREEAAAAEARDRARVTALADARLRIESSLKARALEEAERELDRAEVELDARADLQRLRKRLESLKSEAAAADPSAHRAGPEEKTVRLHEAPRRAFSLPTVLDADRLRAVSDGLQALPKAIAAKPVPAAAGLAAVLVLLVGGWMLVGRSGDEAATSAQPPIEETGTAAPTASQVLADATTTPPGEPVATATPEPDRPATPGGRSTGTAGPSDAGRRDAPPPPRRDEPAPEPDRSTPPPAPARPTPAVTTPPPAPTPDPPAAGERESARIVSVATNQLRQGARNDALSTVIAGLRQQPQDRTLRNFMNQLVADADTEALAARATAVRSGVPELDGDNFKRADQQQQEGRRLRAAGRTSEAVRALWTAADLYAVGARRADEARSRRAASPGAAGDPRSVALDSPPPRTEPPPVVENRPDPEPPPRSPAAPPPPAVVSPDAGIQETIARYATAYESRNPAAVKQVQPSIDENALQTAFRDMRGLSVAVSGVQIQSTDGSTARVAFRIVQTVTGRSGQRTTTTRDRVARLKRTGTASWVIEGFDR